MKKVADFDTFAGRNDFSIYSSDKSQADINIASFLSFIANENEGVYFDEVTESVAIVDGEQKCSIYDYDRLAKEKGDQVLVWLQDLEENTNIDWYSEDEEDEHPYIMRGIGRSCAPEYGEDPAEDAWRERMQMGWC